ncbi:aldo/keto reductase [Sphingomicrobium sp. XHP0239]|uniref:aldo/keto reductase n=1 Tax=Sphingomicrobium maritimum TaxID=3133972 RepID=UPI0031CC674D
MTDQPMLTLNDDRQMPQLGFGTYKIDTRDAVEAVQSAVDVGYRLIDTAAIYGNEEGVGEALAKHPDIWLTTKVWNEDQGYEEAKTAFGHSLNRLGREDVDLLLIHWPCPDKGKFVDTWKALIELREEGRAKSIGVSNFREEDLRLLIEETGFAPAVNQIELHPDFQQSALYRVHEELGIVTQCWSPLGQGDAMKSAVVQRLAKTHDVSPAAIVLRWHLQWGLSAIPKASSREHIEANYAATHIRLSDEEMAQIDALDDPDGRIGPDPNEFC